MNLLKSTPTCLLASLLGLLCLGCGSDTAIRSAGPGEQAPSEKATTQVAVAPAGPSTAPLDAEARAQALADIQADAAAVAFSQSTAIEVVDAKAPANVQTDLEDLSKYIELTNLAEPMKAKWVQVRSGNGGAGVPGPNDYHVVAVLEYDAPQQALADKLDTRREVFVHDDLLEKWIPDAIAKKFVRTDGYLKYDGPAYKANSILKAPLGGGYVLFVENFVFIYGGTS